MISSGVNMSCFGVLRMSLLATASLTAAATLAASAHAQDTHVDSNASTAEIPEIVVTAQRREQRLSDIGLSISAVGSDALKNRNFSTPDDLAKMVTGLSVADSGFATPIYTLRGVGVNEQSLGSSSSVAVYLDEVPLAYPVITQGATFDLERVEVVKGPQGTLYGQNATGGAINYIAKKPTDDFSAGVGATFGRFNRGNVEGYVSGALGPTVRARIAGRAQFGDGWQRSISRKDSLGKIENYTGRLILAFEPSDRARFSLNLNGWIDKSDTIAPQLISFTTGPQAIPGLPVPPASAGSIPVPGGNARYTDWDAGVAFFRDDKFWQVSLRSELDISDEVTLTSISAFSKLKRFQQSDQDGSPYYVLNQAQNGGIESFSQELRLTADFHGVTWIAGANVGNDKTSDNVLQYLPQSIQVSSFGATGARAINDQKIKNWAVFTNIDIPLTDRVSVGGGVRLSKEIRTYRGCSQSPDVQSGIAFTGLINGLRRAAGMEPIPILLPGQCQSLYTTPATLARDLNAANISLLTPTVSNVRLKQDNVPWNINANFKPTDRSMIYARVSRGFKAGNFSTLTALDASAFFPISQESLTAYEVGARASLGRTMSIEAAIFQYDYDDKQLRARIASGPPFGNINAQQNVPKSRIRGADATINFWPVRGLSLVASGTYLDGKITEYVGQNVNALLRDFAGARFNFTPKWSVNVDLNYETPVTGQIVAYGGVNYSYRSKTSGVLVPVVVPSPPSAGDNLSLFDIPSYSLVDAQLGIKDADKRWKAFLWGKNVFNKFYLTNALRASTVNSRYPGQPATYGITVSSDF